jgi:anti-sigma28 factor (negative regulator of flagellin synthesis)
VSGSSTTRHFPRLPIAGAVRQRRIAELSAEVASGTYEVPGRLVAAALLAEAAVCRRLRRARPAL